MDSVLLAFRSPAESDSIWERPALEPPPGVIPDFAHPGGAHNMAYFAIITGGTVATLAVSVRLASRYIMRAVHIEDALFISALGLYSGFLYLSYHLATSPGFRVHQWNVQLKQMPHVLKSAHLASIFYYLVMMLLKVSILLSWVRIFVPLGQRNEIFWMAHLLIWANVFFYGIGTLVDIFQCTPREKIWNPLYVGGHCPIDITKHMIASGYVNLISDKVILLLPQKVIWSLHLSRAQRLGMSLLFAVGVFACGSATARLVYLYRYIHSPDKTYGDTDLILWMIAEITAGFFIMGFPSLPKLIKAFPGGESALSKLGSVFHRSGSGSGSQTNSRRGLPSWYKAPRRKPRDPMDVSFTSEHPMSKVDALSVDESDRGGSCDVSFVTRPEGYHDGARNV